MKHTFSAGDRVRSLVDKVSTYYDTSHAGKLEAHVAIGELGVVTDSWQMREFYPIPQDDASGYYTKFDGGAVLTMDAGELEVVI